MRLSARFGPISMLRGIHRNTYTHQRFATSSRCDTSLTVTEPAVLAKRHGQTPGGHE